MYINILSPLDYMHITLVNQTRDQLLADHCDLARSFWERGRGLLGRTRLDTGEGLIIYPEWAVHSLFMRFPIDVLFMSGDNRVLGLRATMVPNRLFAGKWGARYVVELPAGLLAATNTQVGDQLLLTPPPHSRPR